MFKVAIGDPISVRKLSDLKDPVRKVESRELIGLCIEHSVECYYPVPDGKAVGIYGGVNVVSPCETLPKVPGSVGATQDGCGANGTNSLVPGAADDGLTKSESRVSPSSLRTPRGLKYRSGMITLQHDIRHLAVCDEDLNALYLNGDIRRTRFFGTGLELIRGAYYKTPHRIAEIVSASGTGIPEAQERYVPSGTHPSIEQLITPADLYVSIADFELLKRLVFNLVPDHWGHRDSAPCVYRMFVNSFRSCHEQEIVDDLMKFNKKVFIKKVAESAARVIKIDVRGNAENGINFSKIQDNEFGKNYLRFRVSKRMALVLYATDRWLRDQALMRPQLEARKKLHDIIAVLNEKGDPKREREGIMQQDREISRQLKSDFGGSLSSGVDLERFLKKLGFSSGVAAHLTRIICGETG